MLMSIQRDFSIHRDFFIPHLNPCFSYRNVIVPFKPREEWYCSPHLGTNDDFGYASVHHWFPWVVNNIIPPSVWREQWHIYSRAGFLIYLFEDLMKCNKKSWLFLAICFNNNILYSVLYWSKIDMFKKILKK